MNKVSLCQTSQNKRTQKETTVNGNIVQRHVACFSYLFSFLHPVCCSHHFPVSPASSFAFIPPCSRRSQNIVSLRTAKHSDYFYPSLLMRRVKEGDIYHPLSCFLINLCSSLHFNGFLLYELSGVLNRALCIDPITGNIHVVCCHWSSCCVLLVGGPL